MPIETSVTHIADLEPLYPLGTDNRLQGDNHIRNIKTALVNDLPLTTPSTAIGRSILTGADAASIRTIIGVPATSDVYAKTETYSDTETDAAIAAAVAGLNVAQLQSIDYTLAGNALTLKLNPTTLDFRSTTLTSGAVTTVSNATQITTTISSGSTGGTVSAVQSDIVILAINNAGVMELAWTNLSGGTNLDETGLITTVAEGGAGAADSATVIYSTTARTSVAYRVVGLFRSTQTTAGAWAQTPTLVQGIGGLSLLSPNAGQKWQDFTGSRALSTTYYNTTGREIAIQVFGNCSATNALIVTIGGIVLIGSVDTTGSMGSQIYAQVPAGAAYSVAGAGGSIITWREKR